MGDPSPPEPTIVQLWRVTLDRMPALVVVLHLVGQTILQVLHRS